MFSNIWFSMFITVYKVVKNIRGGTNRDQSQVFFVTLPVLCQIRFFVAKYSTLVSIKSSYPYGAIAQPPQPFIETKKKKK